MNCKDISADWAAQRIKGLSLGVAIIKAISLKKNNTKNSDGIIKTLIDSFRYPRKGPGMMWEAAADKIQQNGGTILLGARVTKTLYRSETNDWVITYLLTTGEQKEIIANHVISSIPMQELFFNIEPPSQCISAAKKLKYRDFLTVALILKDREIFSDNWIYIHDSSVKVGRIQNFKSWSSEMVPDKNLCCYGLEYFCFEGDGTWSSSDDQLIKLASMELEKLGLASREDVIDGCVVRQAKAYPVYDDEYKDNVNMMREEINKFYPNLHLVGRNGMHKYNNQDHAMMTAMLTVENIISGKIVKDVWSVNEDAEYLESGTFPEESTVSTRMVPKKAA